jgi:tryptophanyl-tRNA synthetase
MTSQPKKRVLSGMQPSGLMHLGNYLGALQNWKQLQDEHECYFFVADWHALSTNYADTSRIREYVRELLIDWLAAGIDPTRSVVFIQSRVPEHAVLHLLLSMMIPVSWLERNPTYKEKQEEIKEKDLSTYGFLGYPVLQAADILLYKPDFVGEGSTTAPRVDPGSGETF